MQVLSDNKMRSLFVFAFVLLGMFLVETRSLYAGDNPKIVNENTGVVYSDLQTAINEANAENILKIKGECIGPFIITKTLTLIGKDDAVLDGANAVTVLTTFPPYGSPSNIVVTLDNLTIKHGLSSAEGEVEF